MQTNKEYIEMRLRQTHKEGIEELLEYMDKNGFYTAPCSSSHHLAKEGGLAQHSINVARYAIQLLNDFSILGDACDFVSAESVMLCALLHDLGKIGQFGKPFYIENRLKSGKLSEAKPYSGNPDLLYEEHEIRSVIIASKFIELTEAEQHAILHHNSLWGRLDTPFSSQVDKHPLSLIIHFADLWCARMVEE